MNDSCKDILNFVKENDVKFIRLAFCDHVGGRRIFLCSRANWSGRSKAAFRLTPGSCRLSSERRHKAFAAAGCAHIVRAALAPVLGTG